jgi:predicted ester cyclase
MSADEGKAVVRRFLDEVFNNKNLAAIDDLFTPDYVFHASGGAVRGLAGIRRLCDVLLTAFPDLHVTVDAFVAEGDRVAGRYTWGGTQRGELSLPGLRIPPTGKQVTWTATTISRIADGKIAEDWEDANWLGVLRQLGAIITPPPENND